jgi:hypothetical protein
MLHPMSCMMTAILCNRFKSRCNSLSVSLLFLHITFSMSKQLSAVLAAVGLPLFSSLYWVFLEFCMPYHYTVLTHNIFTLKIHELAVIFFSTCTFLAFKNHQITAWTPFCSSKVAMFNYLYTQYTVDGGIIYVVLPAAINKSFWHTCSKWVCQFTLLWNFLILNISLTVW